MSTSLLLFNSLQTKNKAGDVCLGRATCMVYHGYMLTIHNGSLLVTAGWPADRSRLCLSLHNICFVWFKKALFVNNVFRHYFVFDQDE